MEAIATAFLLSNGPPPRQLVWRPGGFAKNSAAALKYCRDLEALIRTMSPTIKSQRLGVWRNRVLRQIYTDMGIPRRKS